MAKRADLRDMSQSRFTLARDAAYWIRKQRPFE
jgi:hypothetical protein